MTKALQEPSFLILTALAAGPKHGYAVLQSVEELSDGRVTLRAGTLYTALDRLSAESLVEVASEEVVDGRLRRTYRITGAGAALLAEEVDRMRTLASAAVRNLKLGGLGA